MLPDEPALQLELRVKAMSHRLCIDLNCGRRGGGGDL